MARREHPAVKFGLQVDSFTWPGGAPALAGHLERIVRTADDVGFDSIWVMDHLFQIRSVGRGEEPMLEGWTALGFIGAHHEAGADRADGRRHPLPPAGHLGEGRDDPRRADRRAGVARARRCLERDGIAGPRVRFPPLGVRFEMLEETLQIAHEMFEGELVAARPRFDGRHYQPARLLNSPQSISRPRVPIMIGGGGEQKTLRLVAQYGDATNVFGGPDPDPSQVRGAALATTARRSVDRSTRSSAATLQGNLPSAADGSARCETPARIIDRFGELGDAGAQHVIVGVRGVDDTSRLELVGRDVIPQLRGL